jgi:hypothetical protein
LKEREDKKLETMNRIRSELGVRLMRHAQSTIVDVCIALSSLQLLPYVLLWIVDFLPNFDKLSHVKKIRLIESVRASILKFKGGK